LSQDEPFDDLLWDLDQALIWVATRDAVLVNSASREMARSPRLTWILARIGALPADDAPLAYTFVLAPREAETALRRAIYEGRIKAYEDGVEISAHWAGSAKFVNRSPDRMVLLRTPDGVHSPEPLYREPRFDAAHVAAVFPMVEARKMDVSSVDAPDAGNAAVPAPATEEAGQPREMARFSEARARQIYSERVASWPAGTKPPSEADDLAYLRSFMRINRDAVRRLRADAEEANPKWRSPGRPKSRK